MLRIILATTVLAGIYLADPYSARAAEGPWCALRNFGTDISEDCQFRTFAECQQTIVSGFRGFCNQNPRWMAEPAKSSMRRKG